MKKLPYNQQKIIDLIKDTEKRGYEVTQASVGIHVDSYSIKALLKKGLIKEVERKRKTASGYDWNYVAYELTA